jgi:coproporphyrinogen III oxidase
VIEKAAVNFSRPVGAQLPPAATERRPELAGAPFEAASISLIVHPRNPYAPTTHANFRGFFVGEPGDVRAWWFGGGYDLTPYYGFDEDCRHWHTTAKAACDRHGPELHARFKQWCDEYFFLAHRDEPRGIGGVFFDEFRGADFESAFAFVRDVAGSFLPAYLPILERRKDTPYGEREREFQCYRRGRYVEFNLVYDRGTKYGLQSGSRPESVLASLPPRVTWRYDWRPDPGTPEARLYDEYLTPRAWI